MGWLRSDIDDERRAPDLLVKLRSALSFPDVKKIERDLGESGIKKGHVVLDADCGGGEYSIAAARLVGDKGRVHSMTLHPTRIENIEKWARGSGLSNLETIYSDLETGLPDDSVDFVILRNVIGKSKNVSDFLRELHRITRSNATVYMLDSGASAEKLTQLMVKDSLFHFMGDRNSALYFSKSEGEFHEI